jgi:hypothetical protein
MLKYFIFSSLLNCHRNKSNRKDTGYVTANSSYDDRNKNRENKKRRCEKMKKSKKNRKSHESSKENDESESK